MAKNLMLLIALAMMQPRAFKILYLIKHGSKLKISFEFYLWFLGNIQLFDMMDKGKSYSLTFRCLQSGSRFSQLAFHESGEISRDNGRSVECHETQLIHIHRHNIKEWE